MNPPSTDNEELRESQVITLGKTSLTLKSGFNDEEKKVE